jgi:hypothetical protein
MMILPYIQRALTALCFITFLTGCHSPGCREWIFLNAKTANPCFNSGKLILEPENSYSHLEMEMTRNHSGIRMYLNILLMQAVPCPDNMKATLVEIILPNETLTIYADLLAGGQRLLIPEQIAGILIETLLDGQSFTVKVGLKKVVIIPNNFEESYFKLLALEIA